MGDDGGDFRGLAGQLNESPFVPHDLPHRILKRLTHNRYAWLTTVASDGTPVPTLVWFLFDTTGLTVYSEPRSDRVTHIFEHPRVSLHLESDGFGSDLVIMSGTAAVTAEGADPREDKKFWAKYHVEADATGLGRAIAAYSSRITITPTTLWTTLAT